MDNWRWDKKDEIKKSSMDVEGEKTEVTEE